MYGPGSARRLVSSDLLTWNGGRNAIYPLKTFSCMEQSDCIFIFQQHTFLWFLGFWSGNFVHERSCFRFKGYFDSLLTLKQCWIVEKNEQKSMISALRVVPVFVWTFLTSSICPNKTQATTRSWYQTWFSTSGHQFPPSLASTGSSCSPTVAPYQAAALWHSFRSAAT